MDFIFQGSQWRNVSFKTLKCYKKLSKIHRKRQKELRKTTNIMREHLGWPKTRGLFCEDNKGKLCELGISRWSWRFSTSSWRKDGNDSKRAEDSFSSAWKLLTADSFLARSELQETIRRISVENSLKGNSVVWWHSRERYSLTTTIEIRVLTLRIKDFHTRSIQNRQKMRLWRTLENSKPVWGWNINRQRQLVNRLSALFVLRNLVHIFIENLNGLTHASILMYNLKTDMYQTVRGQLPACIWEFLSAESDLSGKRYSLK